MAENDNANKRDYKQELTDKLITRIEAARDGLAQKLEWVPPWLQCSAPPFNPVTDTRYKGINFIACMSAGFSDPRFLTFNNIQALATQSGSKLQIKRGEKGIPVFKAIQIELKSPEQEGKDGTAPAEQAAGTHKLIWTLAYAGTVFNASQIEGMEPLQPREFTFEPVAAAEQLAEALQLKTHLKIKQTSQAKACYVPSKHEVRISPPEQFISTPAYYDTLLHELGHSTGPALGRDMKGKFGSASYAFEELVAELSSVFVGAELGIPHDPALHENHAAYLDSWLKALKDDKNCIFKAAALATKACSHQMTLLQEFRHERSVEPSSETDVGKPARKMELEM